MNLDSLSKYDNSKQPEILGARVAIPTGYIAWGPRLAVRTIVYSYWQFVIMYN